MCVRVREEGREGGSECVCASRKDLKDYRRHETATD